VFSFLGTAEAIDLVGDLGKPFTEPLQFAAGLAVVPKYSISLKQSGLQGQLGGHPAACLQDCGA